MTAHDDSREIRHTRATLALDEITNWTGIGWSGVAARLAPPWITPQGIASTFVMRVLPLFNVLVDTGWPHDDKE